MKRCSTKRARAATRRRLNTKRKEAEAKRKPKKTRVPYTTHHLHNALDALIDSHYNKGEREKTVLSVRKAAQIYLGNKFSTLNRFCNKWKVIKKIKTIKITPRITKTILGVVLWVVYHWL